MAEFHEGTGVITKTSSDSCEVSVTIGNTSFSVSFNKPMFYTFGMQCEGSMTNILEDGMEVELCYRTFSPGKRPCIVAVWLGEKPENIMKDKSSLEALYGIHGNVVNSTDDDFLVQDRDNNIVYIKKEVVFQDGSLLKDNLTIGQEIIFDGVPFSYDHPSGASYQATCAWIGTKPRLVDRFDLRSTKLDSGLSGRDIVEGTVAVIPNDAVALVDVLLESTSIKVFIFRSSLKDRCARIGDVIDVGDVVCMRLAYKSIFPGRKLWYASQASKNRDDVCFDQEISLESLLHIDSEPPEQLSEILSDVPPLSDIIPLPLYDYEVSNVPVADERLSKFSKDTEVLCDVPPLSGVISLLPHGQGACIIYGFLKIFVHRDNFFIAGSRCSDAEFMNYIAPGTNIAFFEAILLSDSEKRGFTHGATCAWVGRNQKPTVQVLVSPLCKPNPYLLERGRNFVGFVVKYLSPFMACVFIPDEKTFVLIDVSNFVTQPQYLSNDKAGVYITNYVKLNDAVQFNLQVNPRFPELFLTYNIRFVSFGFSGTSSPDLNGQVSPELNTRISSVEKSLPIQKRTRRSRTKKTAVVGATKKSSVNLPPPSSSNIVENTSVKSLSPPPSDTVENTPVKSLSPPPSDTVENTQVKSPSSPPSSPFRKDCLSKNRGFLLNCSAHIIVEASPKGIKIKINHIFGTSSVNLTRVGFVPGDVLFDSYEMSKFNGVKVRFDAEFISSQNRFDVLRLWKEDTERPDCECLLASSLARWERLFVTLSGCLETREVFYSVVCIHSIPLPDAAIASVEKTGLSVLVPLESLSTLEEVNAKTSSIDQFLNVGDKVVAKIVKRDYNGVSYFRTDKCLLGTNSPGEVSSDEEFETCGPRLTTWNSIWGLGAWYRKGSIVFENGEYCVLPKETRSLVSSSFSLFDKGKVFVDGQLVNPDLMKEHVGEEVTVHFAQEQPDSTGDSFVAWAWIGEEPPLEVMLLDLLSVPKGFVSSQWRYEVVVADFPVPTHALCYNGHVPFLVRLLKDSSESNCTDVKVGDRLVVEIEEVSLENSVIILSDSETVVKASEYPVKDVYRNLSGTIISCPEPTGKIRVADGDFEVCFELCHVRCFEESDCSNLGDWYDFARNKIAVGRNVYFSATKIESGSAPCRAFEVYLDN